MAIRHTGRPFSRGVHATHMDSAAPFLVSCAMTRRPPPALDRIDVKILATLQEQGRMTIQRLADIVGLSPRPCLERVRRLESAGIIVGYRAEIDLDKLRRPVTVFTEVTLEKQTHKVRFERYLADLDEAVECWEVSGTSDYLIRFVCSDLVRYDTLTAAMTEDPALGVARTVSHIALRPVRRFKGFPSTLFAKEPRGS